MSSEIGNVSETLVQRLRDRVPVIRATDVILASLQSGFSQENLLGTANAFRFNRNDPKHSRVWICAPDNRVMSERDGASMLITVDRGDYTPGEMHLQNYAGGNMSDTTNFTDLAATTVYIRCEAGSRIQSELLASIAYNILKMFRRDLMKEFDIHSLRLLGISTPQELNDAPGNLWLTMVSVRVELQEFAFIAELSNQINKVSIVGTIRDNVQQNLGSDDTSLAFPPVEPLPGFPGTPEHK